MEGGRGSQQEHEQEEQEQEEQEQRKEEKNKRERENPVAGGGDGLQCPIEAVKVGRNARGAVIVQ